MVAAWEQALSAESLEDRRAQAQIVLAALPAVREAAQLDFLLACEGADAIDDALLRAEYLRLGSWEGLETNLAARISGDDVPQDIRRGAVRAAQQVPLIAAPIMEALGARLKSVDGGAEARTALRAITGRDFASEDDFLNWWEDARSKRREIWLQDSLVAAHAQIVEDWRIRLVDDPAAAVRAVDHPVGEVRHLGYLTLRRLPAPVGRSSESPEAQAIIRRMQKEEVPEFRELIIPMVTRFLQGQDAVSQLSVAVDRGRSKEKELAASQLRHVEPPSVALEAFRSQLDIAYPKETVQAAGSPGYRLELWHGLASLAREAPLGDVALESFETDVIAFLDIEPDPDVKDYIFEAAGELGLPAMIEALEVYVEFKKPSVREHVRAVRAMTRIAERTGEVGGLRESLPGLLADQDRAIRRQAIESFGKLPLEEGPTLLIERLPLEHETGLQADLLGALRKRSAPETLDPLLIFQPESDFESSYSQTVAAVVGEDWGRLTRALDSLVGQKRYWQARRLIKLFPGQTLTDPQIDTLARREARVLANYLLQVGIEDQSPSIVTDAALRLSEQTSATPDDPEWPLLRVRLQLVRGEVKDAIIWLETYVLPAPGVPELVTWELALDCLSGARAMEEHFDAGRGLIALLGEPPAEFKFRAEQEFAFFVEPESVDEPEAEEPTTEESQDTPVPTGEPAPAGNGGGLETGGQSGESGGTGTADPGKEPTGGTKDLQ